MVIAGGPDKLRAIPIDVIIRISVTLYHMQIVKTIVGRGKKQIHLVVIKAFRERSVRCVVTRQRGTRCIGTGIGLLERQDKWWASKGERGLRKLVTCIHVRMRKKVRRQISIMIIPKRNSNMGTSEGVRVWGALKVSAGVTLLLM